MAELTLRQAAQQVGVSRQTIYRMVAEGRLTATLRPDPTRTGQGKAKGEGSIKVIDSAELLRVFGRLTPPTPATVAPGNATGPTGLSMTGGATGQAPGQVEPKPGLQAMTASERHIEAAAADRAALRAELTAAREALAATQAQLAEAKEREGKLLDLLAGQGRLLEHKAVAEAPPPRGFWRRMFGK